MSTIIILLSSISSSLIVIVINLQNVAINFVNRFSSLSSTMSTIIALFLFSQPCLIFLTYRSFFVVIHILYSTQSTVIIFIIDYNSSSRWISEWLHRSCLLSSHFSYCSLPSSSFDRLRFHQAHFCHWCSIDCILTKP